ncbi:hypothetical protein MJO29_004892 [Puccinia striiformis f. sp. tritici]|nr:hypothetical protein MJO29_004892 [Puccinia striiformis f. sp. tritici]
MTSEMSNVYNNTCLSTRDRALNEDWPSPGGHGPSKVDYSRFDRLGEDVLVKREGVVQYFAFFSQKGWMYDP